VAKGGENGISGSWRIGIGGAIVAASANLKAKYRQCINRNGEISVEMKISAKMLKANNIK